MEVLTAKATRRSTRIRIEIPIVATSLDRVRPFSEKCLTVIVSAQGCGFRSSHAIQLETPIILSELPGGGSVTARVANCLPLGDDGKFFLIGAALYTHGNVWGVPDPPADWETASESPAGGNSQNSVRPTPKAAAAKKAWPYNLSSAGPGTHPGKK